MPGVGLRGCIGGVVPPICTPMLDARTVDHRSLARLHARLVGGGVSGIFALGSTGEASYLTDLQRHHVVSTLLTANAASAVPLLVGVVETTALRAVDAYERLPKGEIGAVVVTGPFYAIASPKEIVAHFEYVSSHVREPVLAYNIPVNIGYELPVDVLVDLMERGVVAGIKDSSPNLTAFRQVVSALGTRRDLALFTGSDGLLDCALAVGANGCVAGLSNIAPELFVEAMSAHARGDSQRLAGAQQTISQLTALYTNTEPVSGVNSTQLGSIKTALWLQGVIDHDDVSLPMRRSSPARAEYVKALLERCGVLQMGEAVSR
ncbi:MAG TPA: dihydrodipicolinate synthase family protein [Acidimicrobiales bacterium]|nr:dihydrodipicolinate synthase family protein [Acidimicrobiales bacterium]